MRSLPIELKMSWPSNVVQASACALASTGRQDACTGQQLKSSLTNKVRGLSQGYGPRLCEVEHG